MGLVKRVFDKVGTIVDDSKWKHVEFQNVEMRYWVEKFANNAFRYDYSRKSPEYYWDVGIAFMTLNIFGKIINPNNPPIWRSSLEIEYEQKPEFELSYKTKMVLDDKDQKIIELGLENALGQYDIPWKEGWFESKRKMVGLK